MQESFGAYIPFVDHLGFELVFFDEGQSELRYTPEPEHMNSFNVTHGGAVMTLLDVTLASAARSVDRGMGVVTIEMKTTFMRPAKVPAGQALVGKGHLQHRTRSMAFTEGRIYDTEGQLCATATGTFKYVSRRETPSPSTD